MISDDMLQRIINIEAKLDMMMCRNDERNAGLWNGHKDQLFGGHTYSQHGEDLIIAGIFYQLGIRQPDFIDIGAHHPFNISNTALLSSLGSTGINIEANPNLFQNFIQYRPNDINLNIGVGPVFGVSDFYMIDELSGRNTFSKDAANSFIADNHDFSIKEIIPIEIFTFEYIISTYYNGKCPMFLSIDIEGLDYSVLKTVDFNRFRPVVICAEAVFSGSSVDNYDIVSLLQDVGYFVYCNACSNIIFVESEYKNKLFPWTA